MADRAGRARPFASPTPAQSLGWPAIARDQNTLILAPTGSGKTLAAFLWGLNPIVADRLAARPAALVAVNGEAARFARAAEAAGVPAAFFETGEEAAPRVVETVRPGDVVLVKPNVAFERSAPLGATSSPDVVAALVRLCREAGGEKLDAGPKGLVLQFRGNAFRDPVGLVGWLQKQGGLARLSAGANGEFGAQEIPVDAQVQNEFNANRSNVERTLAMAKRDMQPNSATSQFFFNLSNNASNLDSQNGGFAVFARVLDDRSWGVVTSITSGVTTINRGAPYDNLPTVTGSNTADGFEDSELVVIWDAEIIKPQGVSNFYQYKYYYPEGFAGSTINEFLPISNPNAATAHYQVIVRSERAQTQPAATPGDGTVSRAKVSSALTASASLKRASASSGRPSAFSARPRL